MHILHNPCCQSCISLLDSPRHICHLQLGSTSILRHTLLLDHSLHHHIGSLLHCNPHHIHSLQPTFISSQEHSKCCWDTHNHLGHTHKLHYRKADRNSHLQQSVVGTHSCTAQDSLLSHNGSQPPGTGPSKYHHPTYPSRSHSCTIPR